MSITPPPVKSRFESFDPAVQKTRTQSEPHVDMTLAGPKIWKALHLMARGYKKEKAQAWRAFGEILPQLLPCRTCTKHATTFMQKHRGEYETALQSRSNMERFFFDFHNEVNRSKTYPSPQFPHAEFERNMKKFDLANGELCQLESTSCSSAPKAKPLFKCTATDWVMIAFTVFVIGLLVVAGYMYWSDRKKKAVL